MKRLLDFEDLNFDKELENIADYPTSLDAILLGCAPSFFANLQWPPHPHPLTELRFSDQDHWGADEWRRYAEILIEVGHELVRGINDLEERLRIANQLKSRTKPPNNKPSEFMPGRTLIEYSRVTGFVCPPIDSPRRGRKAGSPRNAIAEAAIAEKERRLLTGERYTAKEVVIDILKSQGLSGWRAERDAKTILNIMGSMRKAKRNPNK